ncbi:MAG: hypothetical protein MUC36_03535 [Planctomycetes bacterium]|jgi:hypothetical protein|nr:hypothetical protein [Planctomycetota bacterium]
MHILAKPSRRLAAVLVATLFLVSILLLQPEPAAPAATGGPPTLPASNDVSADTTADQTTGTLAEHREAAPAKGTPAADLDLSFEQRIDELVGIGQRTAELAQQDDTAGAQASDQEARQRFTALLTSFADAGERAVAMATTLSCPLQDQLDHGRRMVLQLVLATELGRRDQEANGGDRGRIDAFTQLVLDSIPTHATAADIGANVLADQPYLRAAHEPTVLQFLRLATDGLLPREVATRLLLTLWANLQRHGERSSDELSALALVLLDDTDPSQRTAACRQLLHDARYRPLMLAWLRDRSDRSVATEVANLAARELPPTDAITVLRELGPLLPRATGAWMAVGFRAPELVADTYRELLGTDVQPAIRSDVVTAIGMTRTPLADEISELALTSDPSPDVRIQAVFVLSTRQSAEVAERALDRALDDRLIAADPIRLGSLVLALQNLEANGFLHSIDRIGQRLRGLPLAEHSRQTLEGMLARSLPGGGNGLGGNGSAASQDAPLPR